MCTGIRLLLLICPFNFFIFPSLQFSKFFITFFSGTVRLRRLKLGTHVDSEQMYRMYWNQAAAYSSLYFFSFLSNFQTLKFFVALFSGTVRPIKLKLYTYVDNGWMFHVHHNQAVASYLSHILHFSFSPMFKN